MKPSVTRPNMRENMYTANTHFSLVRPLSNVSSDQLWANMHVWGFTASAVD